MTIKVYHLKYLTEEERKRLNGPGGGWDCEPRFSRYANITCSAKDDDIVTAIARGEYMHVADVATNDLETAYRQTNHITDNWTLNDDVTAYHQEPRSSMVGDLFVDAEGNIEVCKPFGFSPLSVVRLSINALLSLGD